MNCREFETRVQHLLDRGEPPASDARLWQHAEACSRCAARLDAYQGLVDRLALCQPPRLDAEFSRRVLQRAFPVQPVAHETRGQGRHNLSLYLVAGLIAGLLLIAALPRLRSALPRIRPAAGQLAISVPATSMQAESARSEAAEPALPRQVSSGSRATSAEPRFEDDWRALWEDWSSRLAPERLESLDALTEGIKPITSSLTTALDSLRTTFPWSPEQPTGDVSEDSASSGEDSFASQVS